MIAAEIEIANKLGLHARAAAKLVSTAAKFQSAITIHYAGQSADAKSIMSIMMLAAAKGSWIIIECDGDDQKQALDELCKLIDNFFGEEE